MKLVIFIEDLPQMLPTKFRFNWLSSFRENDFQKSTDLKQELPVAAMFANESGRNEHSLQRTFHRCLLPSFGSFGKVVSEENLFQKSTNKKQEFPVVAMFVNESGRNEQSLQRTYMLSTKFQIIWESGFRGDFLEINQLEKKNGLWWPCLFTDWN